MPASVLTTRLPEWLSEELREEYAKYGDGPSEGLRRVVEEWWVRKNLPAIEYRDSLDGPRPAMKEGPELWSFFMVRRSYGDDLEGISEHGNVDQISGGIAWLSPAEFEDGDRPYFG